MMMQKKNNENCQVDKFIFCCQEMDFAQKDERILIDYDPNENYFFIRATYPFYLDFYSIICCPFCGIDLRNFHPILKS